MFARATTIQGPTEQMEAGLSGIREQIIPSLRELSGFQGVITLADRTSGKGITITLWDTEEDLRTSEQQADQLRTQAAGLIGATQAPQVDRYEVVLLDVEAGVRVT